MREDEILTLFKQAALEVGNYTFEELGLDDKIADLQITSVEMLEIVGYMEQRIKVRLNDDELSRVTTLRELTALIQKSGG